MDPQTPSAPRPKTYFKPWFLALFSVFLLGGVFSLRLLGDADLGFHLRGGKEIVENHHIPQVDSYTYTRAGQPYLDLHWAYQAFLYLIQKGGGYKAISLLNALFVLIVLFFLYRRLKVAGAPLFMVVPLLFLFLLASEIRFQVRPEVVSWLLMSLMLLVLEQRTKTGKDLLFLLPVLQLVWVNTEGLFAIGWVLMGAYLLSSWVHGPQLDRRLLAFSSTAILACLINPYFLKGFLHPFELLATIGTSNIFKSTIVEFQPPWKLLGLGPFGPHWAVTAYTLYSGLVVLLVGATFRNRKVHEILLTGAFLYLSATVNRNIPLFQLVSLPLAATCWKELKWEWLRKAHDRSFSSAGTAWIFMGFILALGAKVAMNGYYIDQGRTIRTGWGLDQEFQPVEATEFLVKNHLEGRVLNEMNVGGWLDWAIPQPIFVDGRLEVMGAEFYGQQMAAKLQKGGLASEIAQYHPDIILMLGIDTPQWFYDLKEMPDWRLAFVSRSGVVYLRKGYAPQVPVLEGEKLLAGNGIARLSPEETKGLLADPGAGSFHHWMEDFYAPQYYPRGFMRMAMLYHSLGDYRMAEPIYLECIRLGRGKYYDEYLNLGMLYFQDGSYEESRTCMERVMKMKPGEPQALSVLQNLPH